MDNFMVSKNRKATVTQCHVVDFHISIQIEER
jgi:hypothetical protein